MAAKERDRLKALHAVQKRQLTQVNSAKELGMRALVCLDCYPNRAAATGEGREVVIGAPYKQDTRAGRTTCQQCRKPSPPWGQINRSDERRLARLFPGLSVKASSFVGSVRSETNPVSTMLMDMAGNAWEKYERDEACIYCGVELIAPARRSILSRVCSGLPVRIHRVQSSLTRAHRNWIHIVFSKDGHP